MLFIYAGVRVDVFMDIVDIFNPLISTDHLDDILILESNLESEVCDDCGTEPETLGGSLRNMLSDKDPMLGSASAQFSLPFSDTEDSNFQLTCSTGRSDLLFGSCACKNNVG